MHLNADAPSSSNVLSPQGIEDTNGPTGTSGIVPSATLSGSLLPRVGRSKSLRGGWDLAKSIPLKDLIPALTRVQKAFFEKLDSELDKVETFYVEREKDMRTRTTVLKSQLHELQEHRRVFHQAEQANHPWFTMRQSKILRNPYHLLDKNLSKRRSYKAQSESPPRRQPEVSENNTMEEMTGSPRLKSPFQHLENSENGTLKDSQANGSNSTSASGASGAEDVPKGWQKVHHSFRTHAVTNKLGPQTHPNGASKYDPDEYVHAKKSLKKAVLECYRGLEVLENYRTLNLIGFRKALKKFEKTTGIPAQQAYFMEKIEPSAFSSGVAVQGMVNQMEELYAARFTRGDNKLAKTRLRGGQARHKTRHSSVFISGLLLGMAIPAFADAIYLSFQPETRRAIPGHDGLLYVYSIFLIPVLFILLVGVNILGWHRARINYVFIFEFDLKTKLDYREFFEV
ncbi:SPX domain-containing protein [Cytidiella melzeri]|nr:SPX domain-containing protein [Cytidiella melzeri]